MDDRLLDWVQRTIHARPAEVRGLRDGGAPWRLRFADRADLVLRVATGAEPIAVERAGLDLAARYGIPAPGVVAADAEHDPPVLLVEAIGGSSAIPAERRQQRLRALGALAADVHRIAVPPEAGLPRRTRPIPSVDFAALRSRAPQRPLLHRAEAAVAAAPSPEPEGFVHGDLWQGNAMWDGDRLLAVIDWDCAGSGPAGVDLGSLRCDAAVCFGLGAAEDVLDGWQEAAARPAENIEYWDVVAALSTPPEMGWFVDAIRGQGRIDLTQEIIVEQRDEFLAAALERI
jgi:aminoglycoside phosphotransferase (APT) family kinase protein